MLRKKSSVFQLVKLISNPIKRFSRWGRHPRNVAGNSDNVVSPLTAHKPILCSDPVIGRGLAEFGYDFLINACSLDDNVFEKVHGRALSREDRIEFQKIIERHWVGCGYCKKKSYETEKDLKRHDGFFVSERKAS
jgi:hypothetical protein